VQNAIQRHITYIRALVQQGGPTPAQYADLEARMGHLCGLIHDGTATESDVADLRAAFGDAISPATLQGLVYCKPHGYAGDYQIIDRIYQNHVAPDPQLAAWDKFFHSSAGARAVRNRKAYFHRLLDHHVQRRNPLRVLKLASGPGRSMFEWLETRPSSSVQFDCVELDPNAIEYASRLNREFMERIRFTQKNALRFRPEGEYDLIWAAGLFDYFPDRLFAHLLKRLLTAIAPGGELVIGNFSASNPSQHYMELFDWSLHLRTAKAISHLAEGCGILPSRIRVGCEPLGVNLFLHVQGDRLANATRTPEILPGVEARLLAQTTALKRDGSPAYQPKFAPPRTL